MKWVVQEFRTTERPRRAIWADIPPADDYTSPDGDKQYPWEADTAAEAFLHAVLWNRDHKTNQTRYRVLPYIGGVTYSMGVESTVHRDVTS